MYIFIYVCITSKPAVFCFQVYQQVLRSLVSLGSVVLQKLMKLCLSLQVSQGVEGSSSSSRPAAEDMTSKDYYFDSYAHFGIHEVAPPPLVPRDVEVVLVQPSSPTCSLLSTPPPPGDAEGRGAHADLPQLHVPQQAPVQGQGGSGRGQRHRHPVHVRRQGRGQEGHRGESAGRFWDGAFETPANWKLLLRSITKSRIATCLLFLH